MAENMDIQVELTQEMVSNMCHEHYNQGIIDAVAEMKKYIEEHSNDMQSIVDRFENMIADARKAMGEARQKVNVLLSE